MMSGNNKNLNPADILSAMSQNGMAGNGMADMLKNMGGNTGNNNSDMISALSSMMSNGGNFNDLLKNAGGNNNMLSMLPMLQNLMGNQRSKPKRAEPVVETIQNEKRFYNLKPISKIANKDITYVLNQYFAG